MHELGAAYLRGMEYTRSTRASLRRGGNSLNRGQFSEHVGGSPERAIDDLPSADEAPSWFGQLTPEDVAEMAAEHAAAS